MNAFRHSGKLGDIVYSLPAARALGGGIFYVDPTTRYPEKPALGIDAARGMVELLETQSYIRSAAVYNGEPITHDLDRFRDKAVPVHVFNVLKQQTDRIAETFFGSPIKELRRQFIPNMEVDLAQFHWEAVGLPGKANCDVPWITGIQPSPIAEIVISRTGRYSGQLDWLNLKDYAARAVFVGHAEEWRTFQHDFFEIRFHQATSLVDLAQTIAGAKLFVGNQSFGLALADAMLIPRVAELSASHPIRTSSIHAHQDLTHEIMEAYLQI